MQTRVLAEKIWNHPDNRGLRDAKRRKSCLYAGDRVTIPDVSLREVDCRTEKRHRFQRIAQTVELKLQANIRGPEARPQVHWVEEGDFIQPAVAPGRELNVINRSNGLYNRDGVRRGWEITQLAFADRRVRVLEQLGPNRRPQYMIHGIRHHLNSYRRAQQASDPNRLVRLFVMAHTHIPFFTHIMVGQPPLPARDRRAMAG